MADDERIRHVIRLHLHPEHGSPYWLRRSERLGFDARDRIREQSDLRLLGLSSLNDLRESPIRDFIPKAFHHSPERFILGETAGTSGEPRGTAYREDEFQEAFITPFIEAARMANFPRGLPWLWVGPSGPHIIGKAVRELARQTGSMDPFSVDFDARWAKRLTAGTMAASRYLEHVADQAIDILEREEAGVIFTTPPTLRALAGRMADRQREAIRGVHYGGLSMSAGEVNEFRSMFSNAVHLSGYGNTLFGVVMEVADQPRSSLDYFPRGDRVRFEIVHADDPEQRCERGESGRVMFHRLDECCLLPNVLERDEAIGIAPYRELMTPEWQNDGIRDPKPPEQARHSLRTGLY